MRIIKICKVVFVLLVVLALSPFLMVEYLYHSSISKLNLTPIKSQNTYPSFAREMLWRISGETGEIALEQSSASEYLLNIVGIAVIGHGDSFLGIGAGDRIASSVARGLLINKTKGQTDYHIKSAAVVIWLSRHMNIDDLLDYALDNSYFGKNSFGIYSAAEQFFDKTPEALTRNEWLALILFTKRPGGDPYCHPELFEQLYADFSRRFGSGWQLETNAPLIFKPVPDSKCS